MADKRNITVDEQPKVVEEQQVKLQDMPLDKWSNTDLRYEVDKLRKEAEAKADINLEVLQQELEVLKKRNDELAEEKELKDAHILELESKMNQAQTLAHARLAVFLAKKFPDINPKKPYYRLKYGNAPISPGNTGPMDGTMSVNVKRGETSENVNITWCNGYHVTHDRYLAKACVRLGKGILSKVFYPNKGE